MANTYMTTADILNFNLATDKTVVSDVLENAPLLAALYAKPAEGNVHRYMKKTAQPSGGFRLGNVGIETKPATFELVTLELGIYDASWEVDEAVAMQYKGGAEQMVGELSFEAMKAANFGIESSLIYGVKSGAGKFDGLKASAVLTVDAEGTTAGTGSSVYVIVSGPSDVAVAWGNGAVINITDQFRARVNDGSGNPFTVITQSILGNVGLQPGGKYSVVRIKNITEDTGHTLTDKLISDALAKLPVGSKATHIAMSKRSQAQLQQSRTSFNPTGAPAVIPVDAFGTPIIACDSILNNETIESAS